MQKPADAFMARVHLFSEGKFVRIVCGEVRWRAHSFRKCPPYNKTNPSLLTHILQISFTSALVLPIAASVSDTFSLNRVRIANSSLWHRGRGRRLWIRFRVRMRIGLRLQPRTSFSLHLQPQLTHQARRVQAWGTYSTWGQGAALE